jgi:hypothetical protein
MIMYDYVQLAQYYQNQDDKCKREKGNEGVIENKDYQPIYFAEALEVMKPILHKRCYYSGGAGTAMWGYTDCATDEGSSRSPVLNTNSYYFRTYKGTIGAGELGCKMFMKTKTFRQCLAALREPGTTPSPPTTLQTFFF